MSSTILAEMRAQSPFRAIERIGVALLITCGGIVILAPLLLTLYLSVFDETIILFPPKGYTLHWYAAMVPQFARPLLVSLEIGLASMAGSLLVGVPAGLALARYRFPAAARSARCCWRRSPCQASPSASRSSALPYWSKRTPASR